MESKKANLLIDISKKIIEQYRDQLEKSVQESRKKDLDEYSYENFVDRAGRNVTYINNILSNYEKSIFDGKITDNKTFRTIHTRNGAEKREVLYTQEFSKEEREISEALLGIETLFHFIGIPEFAMYPVIADIDTRLQDKIYDNQHNINEDIAKAYDKYFNLNGDYAVGELKFNNTLSGHINADTKTFRYSTKEESRYLYPTGGYHNLIINTNEINELVDEYIASELNEKSITGLKEQNELVKSTMKLLSKMNPNGADSRVEWTLDYYRYFKFSPEGKEYYKYPREVKSKNSKISELEDARSQISKLSDLTKEEQELLNRLAQIQQEKQQILGVVSKLDTIKKEEKPSTYAKPEYPNRQYVDEYHYIENGIHYHLPNWDEINNEKHEFLK